MTEPSIDNDNGGGNDNYLVKKSPKNQAWDWVSALIIF